MNDDRAGRTDTALRYERRPPVASCTRCGAPLWGGDIARVVVTAQTDAFGRDRREVVTRECWSCAPWQGAPGGHGPRPAMIEGEEVSMTGGTPRS